MRGVEKFRFCDGSRVGIAYCGLAMLSLALMLVFKVTGSAWGKRDVVWPTRRGVVTAPISHFHES